MDWYALIENNLCLIMMHERAGFKEMMNSEDFKKTKWYISFMSE